MKMVAIFLVASGAIALIARSALAEEGEADLRAEVAALRAEVAELRAKDQGTWLNERRAQEIKALIYEVLSDAETRASLTEGGLTAGWDKHFFLASEDGNFLLEVEGYFQARYIANFRDESAGGGEDDYEGGFQLRRAKLAFSGHVFDPRLEYKVQLAAERDGGEALLEDAYARYEWADGYFIQIGQFKPGFNREELVSATRQQAVERSTVNNFFRIARAQAVQLSGQYARWNWAAAVHDGREATNVDFDDDDTDVAFSGRAELLLAGDWKQFKDFVAWPDTPLGVLLGGGVDYELAESGRGTALLFDHFWQWTADLSIQLDPVNLFIAGFGRHVSGEPPVDDFDQYGLVAQAGVFVIPSKLDVFGRWEYLDHDGFTEAGPMGAVGDVSGLIGLGLEDETHTFTFGGNYYFRKHDVKLTLDLAWAPDGLRQSDTGAGLLASDNNDAQLAIRGQLQVLF